MVSGISRFHRTPLGEFPPPAPRACFGRDWLIEKIVGLAENFEPIALIGAGGIGKTSIALSILHHNRIRERFGDERRFIRCDQFPISCTHFLARLSKVIGAGVVNPEDLTPLRLLLSSKQMLIILDNAESILDPQGPNAREIFSVVEELCQFPTICVCITSRITTVPRHCKRPAIPPLSNKAACNIFYSIYDDGGRSETISDLVQRLDYHALSVTLLATTASHNKWSYNRLAEEWGTHRAQTLRTDHNESLAATIELSLASPTFLKLGPHARDLLEVVAFFPQGVDEKNLDWFFPDIPERKNIFDKFCALSLTHRSNDFITMLAPVRDYLGPQDPKSSPLLCATKDCYFARLSVGVDPALPGFGETRWIVSEDANVEHLLNVLTSIDTSSGDVWVACHRFMQHIYWHKPRRTVLGPKIEGLPDDHHSKPVCLFKLSQLFQLVGNHTERQRLLTRALQLERDRGNDNGVLRTLRSLSDANRMLDFYEEGIQQAKEALEIAERLGDTIEQAWCSSELAWLLFDSGQLDAAEAAASRAIDLVPEKGQEHLVCRSHRVLGKICGSKGEKEKAIHHFETALGIVSPFNWHDELFWIHYHLTDLFLNENGFTEANTHIEQAKLHAVNNAYRLSRAMESQAVVWCLQLKLEDAKSEVLRVLETYEGFGAVKDVEECRKLLQRIERAMMHGT